MMPPFQNPNEPDPEPAQESPLCLSCLFPNDPAANFCAKCGAPLTSYAATAPFESAFAKGHAYRQATEHPRGLVVVLGIWFIFGPLAGSGIALVAVSRGDPFPTLIGAVMLALAAAIIGKTTWNYFARKSTGEKPDAD